MPLASYFRADHLTLHPFDKLFSSRPLNSPSDHQFGELFSSRSVNSPSVHQFGELLSSRPFDSPSDHPASYFCYFHPYIGMGSNILL